MGASGGGATRVRVQFAAAIVLIIAGAFIRMLTVTYDTQATAHVTEVVTSGAPVSASGAAWGAGTSFAPIPACQVRVDFEAGGRDQQATVSDHPTLCGRHRGDPVTVYYASDNPIQVGLAPSSSFGVLPIVVGVVWLVVLGVRRRLPGSPGLQRRRTPGGLGHLGGP